MREKNRASADERQNSRGSQPRSLRVLAHFCTWLELLGLSLLIGGMTIIGVVVAPTVFGLLPSLGAGGEVMSAVFVRFNTTVTFVCLALIFIGFLGKFFLTHWRTKLRFFEAASLLILLGVGIYIGMVLTPRMEHLREVRIQNPGNHKAVERFGADHRLSQTLFGINLLLGIAVLYVNAIEITRNQK